MRTVQMEPFPHILLVFVDGLGCGVSDPATNPVFANGSEQLADLLVRQSRPIDACLGVTGLPQSATGQAAILTGKNAPAHMGRHIEGFPGKDLRRFIRRHNLLSDLVKCGYSATFANAYYTGELASVLAASRKSVTTVSALHAFGAVRLSHDLYRNEAVFQDLTRESLHARGYTGPTITPADSANHLLAIATRNDFTLFEYFQTDRAGHTQDMAQARRVLSQLSEFVAALESQAERKGITVILTSDHGNIEDMSIRTHTRNPVPFLVFGRTAGLLHEEVNDITGIAPCVRRSLQAARTGNRLAPAKGNLASAGTSGILPTHAL